MAKIICFANSIKNNERCIAGIEKTTGNWIRPVYQDSPTAGIDESHRSVGGEPALLYIIEIIKYDGTSIDPLEIFIKSGMTDASGAADRGKGRIGANFLEAPGTAREEIISIAEAMSLAGLGTFLTLGWPGHSVLQVPINWGRMGGIVIGGLNPIAILEESGINVISKAVSGLVEYESLFPFVNLSERYKSFF